MRKCRLLFGEIFNKFKKKLFCNIKFINKVLRINQDQIPYYINQDSRIKVLNV